MACSSERELVRANSWGSQGMESLGLWNVGGVASYTGVSLWSGMREGGDWLVECCGLFVGGWLAGHHRRDADATGSLYNERSDLNGGS